MTHFYVTCMYTWHPCSRRMFLWALFTLLHVSPLEAAAWFESDRVCVLTSEVYTHLRMCNICDCAWRTDSMARSHSSVADDVHLTGASLPPGGRVSNPPNQLSELRRAALVAPVILSPCPPRAPAGVSGHEVTPGFCHAALPSHDTSVPFPLTLCLALSEPAPLPGPPAHLRNDEIEPSDLTCWRCRESPFL